MLGVKKNIFKMIFVNYCLCFFMLALSLADTTIPDKHEVVLYWGQNTARRNEKPLRYFCENGHYDVIIVNYVVWFFASPRTRLPGLNLALHCGAKSFGKAYPGLFICDTIGSDIEYCQTRGIKVMIGLRSSLGSKWLQSKSDGKELAANIWNLFLGGKHDKRPFKNAVFDGINVDVRSGPDTYLDEFLIQLKALYRGDHNRQYRTTITTSCHYPPLNFKNVMNFMASVIDGVFFKHDYSVDCHPLSRTFAENVGQWNSYLTNKRLFFYIVIVLSPDFGKYVTPYKNFYAIYQTQLRQLSNFKGVVINDAGWDDSALALVQPQNKRYSQLLYALFTPATTPTTKTTKPYVQTTVQAAKKFGVGVFWGSNLAQGTTGHAEKSLYEICQVASYDTIILNTLDDNSDDRNKGNLPGLNFANHCYKPFADDYKTYLKCSKMGSDIKFCQLKGIKVLLNIGASTRFFGFKGTKDAKDFAHTMWKLFLGGLEDAKKENLPRTFGDTILDGVNMEIRHGDPLYVVDYIKELRSVMDGDQISPLKYLITASPSCIHPNFIMKESFSKAITAFDHLFVNFDDQNCNINQPTKFQSAFQIWYDYAIKSDGPYIWVGLPSHPQNTIDQSRFLRLTDAKDKLQSIDRLYPKFGGVILNDASWDFDNLINNRIYSDYIADISKPKTSSMTTVSTANKKTNHPNSNQNHKPNVWKVGGASKPASHGLSLLCYVISIAVCSWFIRI